MNIPSGSGVKYYREEQLTRLMWGIRRGGDCAHRKHVRSVKLIDQLMMQNPDEELKVWTFANDVKSGCKDSVRIVFSKRASDDSRKLDADLYAHL